MTTHHPPTPDAVAAVADQIRRRYTIHVHEELRQRPWWALVWRPYWATITSGIAWLGEPGADVVRGRTAAEVETRCRRRIARDAARRGITDPVVRISGNPTWRG